MKEKEYIIQQIRTGAYDKKYCMDNLGMSKKAWKRYRKHAILHAFPKGISQLRRIDIDEALLVAQEIKRREEEEDSVRVTPHGGGKDTTLVKLL